MVVYNPEGKPILQVCKSIGHGTNNIAEHSALIELLYVLKEMKIEKAQISGDSRLVINQVLRKWRVNHRHLQELVRQAQTLLKDQPDWRIAWIPRELNVADGVGSDICGISYASEGAGQGSRCRGSSALRKRSRSHIP